MKKNNSIIRTRSQKKRKEEEQFGKLIFKLEWYDYLQNDYQPNNNEKFHIIESSKNEKSKKKFMEEEEDTHIVKTNVSLIDDWDTDEQVFNKTFSVEELKHGKQIVKETETNDSFKLFISLCYIFNGGESSFT